MTNFAAAARCCLPGLLLAAGACAPDVYVMRAETVIDGAEQRDHGIGCQMLGAGTNESGVAPGAPLPHFGLRHEHSDDGMRMAVTDGNGKLMLEHYFSRAFLETGQAREFEVTFSATQRLQLRYWGGPSCIFRSP